MDFDRLSLRGLALSAGLAAALAVGAAPAAAVTLYDAALGSKPSLQGWSVLAIGAPAAESVAGSSYRLDTTGAGVVYWGNALNSATLDTAAGFDLSFSLRVLTEAHLSDNRAGYVMTLVGSDPTRSLELSFWSGNVWAQRYDASQPDRFVHGPDAAFDTTAAATVYTLAVRAGSYTLKAGGATLLAGALQDYTAGGAPYTTPNFLFFGDNSSRGTAVTQLDWVMLSAVPEPAPAALLALGLVALAWRLRRQRGSGRGLPSWSMAT